MRAIDADALIDKYGDWYTEEGTEEGYIGTIKGIVDSMPTIEPERKKGKWIPQDWNTHYGMISTAVYYFPKCSVCGGNANYTNFCPDCGAKMNGGDGS